MNFFSWLRDGVKQSVLLGVSDAIEDLGSPADTDQLHPGVAALLARDDGSAAGDAKRITAGTTRGRKRLGKSLKDIDGTSAS